MPFTDDTTQDTPSVDEPDRPDAADACDADETGLDTLRAGDTAVIRRMDETDHAMLIRLKTMGMHPGRAVRVLRPGSRLVVTCGGTRIGLSATVAQHIRVTPLERDAT